MSTLVELAGAVASSWIGELPSGACQGGGGDGCVQCLSRWNTGMCANVFVRKKGAFLFFTGISIQPDVEDVGLFVKLGDSYGNLYADIWSTGSRECSLRWHMEFLEKAALDYVVSCIMRIVEGYSQEMTRRIALAGEAVAPAKEMPCTGIGYDGDADGK